MENGPFLRQGLLLLQCIVKPSQENEFYQLDIQ